MSLGIKIPFLALFCSVYFNLHVEAPSSSRLVHPSYESMTFLSSPGEFKGWF